MNLENDENLLTGEALAQKKRERKLLEEEENKELKEVFNRIFSTSDGKKFADWLINRCGFFQNSVICGRNGILPYETIYNEARRSIYLELRKLLDSSVLIKIEIGE